MPKSNVIPLPATERHLDRRILAMADMLGQTFAECAKEALTRLQQAEATAVQRLEEYVPTERLLNVKEAAAYLGFSKRWLDEGTRPGREPVVPFILIGGEKRFRKTALDQRLQQLEVTPKKAKL